MEKIEFGVMELENVRIELILIVNCLYIVCKQCVVITLFTILVRSVQSSPLFFDGQKKIFKKKTPLTMRLIEREKERERVYIKLNC